ncbi:hypothetical protein BKA62DRAFT_820317 [Auriculariales sp. MPI-PUGE-AT-0066]|nr:hypothetical protein BKA62DRAFT_820317 [Auriculariales sp. MPI-PUGE-AT-0066]
MSTFGRNWLRRKTTQRKRDADDGDRSSSTGSAALAPTEDNTASSATIPRSETPEYDIIALATLAISIRYDHNSTKTCTYTSTSTSTYTRIYIYTYTHTVAPVLSTEKKAQQLVTPASKRMGRTAKDTTSPDQDQDRFVKLQIPRPGVLVEDARPTPSQRLPSSLTYRRRERPYKKRVVCVRASSSATTVGEWSDDYLVDIEVTAHWCEYSYLLRRLQTDVQEISPSEYSAVGNSGFPIPQPPARSPERDLSDTGDIAFASTSYAAFDTAPVSYEWFEHVLPDTSYYFTLEAERSPTRTVVTQMPT